MNAVTIATPTRPFAVDAPLGLSKAVVVAWTRASPAGPVALMLPPTSTRAWLLATATLTAIAPVPSSDVYVVPAARPMPPQERAWDWPSAVAASVTDGPEAAPEIVASADGTATFTDTPTAPPKPSSVDEASPSAP